MKTITKTVDVNEVKPYWRNPRNNTKSLPDVKASIQKYGYTQYIAVDEQNVILAGHTRYKALKELGWDKITVIEVQGLSAQDKKKYRIIDNKSAERSEWNMDDLKTELRELDDITEMQQFFDYDLNTILKEVTGQKVDDVDSGDIAKEAARLDGIADGVIEGRKATQANIICPSCLHEFTAHIPTVKNRAL